MYFAKKPCLGTRTDSHQGGRKSAGSASTTSTDSEKKGGHGAWHL